MGQRVLKLQVTTFCWVWRLGSLVPKVEKNNFVIESEDLAIWSPKVEKHNFVAESNRHGSATDPSELLQLRIIILLWCVWCMLLYNTSSTSFLAIAVWGSSPQNWALKVVTKMQLFRSYDMLSMHHNKLCIKTKHCFVRLVRCYTTDRCIECTMLKIGSSPEAYKTGPFRASQKESSILLIHEPRDLNNLVAF